VTSDFDGETCGSRRLTHRAYDVANAEGTGIYAAYAGTVSSIAAVEDGTYGWWVFVMHYTASGKAYQTFYAHLRNPDPFDPAISLGTNVTRGQRLGFMGNSGTGSGVHLHFEVLRGPPGSPEFDSLDEDDEDLNLDLDSQIGCGKTWTSKAQMPMDFSDDDLDLSDNDLYVRMVWHLRLTQAASEQCFNFGVSTDFPLMGDWNGNGVDSPGIVRSNQWQLDNGFGTSPDAIFLYGNATDSFLAGDWNGDGTDTPGVVRGNIWYLRNQNSAGPNDVPSFGYGQATDRFIVGDWDGNGTETPGVVRGNTWYLRNSNSAGPHDVSFGYGAADPNPSLDQPTDDLPLTGNWDGSAPGLNAFDTHAVVRGNTWYFKNTLSGGSHDLSSAYGREHDTALPTDRDPSAFVEVDTQSIARASMETTSTC